MMEYQWTYFSSKKNNKKKITFATIINWCKEEGINYKTSKSIKSIVDKYPENPIELTIHDKESFKLNPEKCFNMTNTNVINLPKLDPTLYDAYLYKKLLAV